MRRGNPNPSPATRFDGSKPGPGRPKGSRVLLSEQFLSALCADWAEHGVEVLQTVRINDPSTYVRVVAGLLPQKIDLKSPLGDLTDAELAAAIQVLKAAMAADPADDLNTTEPELVSS